MKILISNIQYSWELMLKHSLFTLLVAFGFLLASIHYWGLQSPAPIPEGMIDKASVSALCSLFFFQQSWVNAQHLHWKASAASWRSILKDMVLRLNRTYPNDLEIEEAKRILMDDGDSSADSAVSE